MNLNEIKLVVSEVDGVITTGQSAFGEFNIPMFKTFCMKDFEAINLIKKNWNFAFISSDASISSSLCRKRNIPFFFAERSKKEVYTQILRRYALSPDEVMYIGSTYSDIECLRMSSFSVCPEDAPSYIKNVVDHVAPLYSGEGVISYIYELLDLNKSRD